MKKLVAAAILIGAMGLTTYITFKSLEGLEALDLSDPFEVDFDED
jgi:hypothetical protein